MTATETETTAETTAESHVVTPTLREGSRRARYWVIAVVLVVAVAVAVLALTGVAPQTEPLDPDSPTPDGARALVEVLREQGVAVRVTDTFADTRAEASSPESTTVLVHDPNAFLTDDSRDGLVGLGDTLVLIAPDFALLEALAPGVLAAGTPDDDLLQAGCDLPAAVRADTVSPGGEAYRLAEGIDAETCLVSDSEGVADSYSLVILDEGGSTVTVLGATDTLANGAITQEGNAALALGVLGENETLVWYRPGVLDSDTGVDPSAFTPAWLTPSILLLVLTGIAAAVWRGRRFGPLIVENLPVVVRASETMEGRARLYQRGSARLRALDALRIGAVVRLAARCGLPSAAGVDEVIEAVAALLGRGPDVIRSLLLDERPVNDADLSRLSEGLADLEAAVSLALTNS